MEGVRRDDIRGDCNCILYARKHIMNKPDVTILLHMDASKEFQKDLTFREWMDKLRKLLGKPTEDNFAAAFKNFLDIFWMPGEKSFELDFRLKESLNIYRDVVRRAEGVD